MASPRRSAWAGLALGVLLSGATPLASQGFNDASWRLTATADEILATLSSFTVPPLGSFDLWWLPASPRVSIEMPGSILEADLVASPSLSPRQQRSARRRRRAWSTSPDPSSISNLGSLSRGRQSLRRTATPPRREIW
ncbi:MAG: hypothetical protein RLZZ117_1411 [Cyanobacteriota bacterium]